MSIETDIFTRLSTFPGLVALVGARVYPLVLPQGASLPALTYQRISGRRVQAHSGDSGLQAARYQLTAWADTLSAVAAVAEQARLALQGETSAGVGLYENQVDLYEPETGRYQVAVDLTMWHAG